MQDAEEDEILKRVSAKLLKNKKMRVNKVYNEVIQDKVKLIQESSNETDEDSSESELEPDEPVRRKKVIKAKPKQVIKEQYFGRRTRIQTRTRT
jgi:hypothetical protein